MKTWFEPTCRALGLMRRGSIAGARARVVMIGTDPDGRGGIATVIRSYMAAGLGARWPMVFLTTHRDGPGWGKFILWLRAWLRFAWIALRGECGVLHIHSASDISFWRKWTFLWLAWPTRTPVIWHVHGGNFDSFWSEDCSAWQQRQVQRAMEAALHVVVLSSGARDALLHIAPRARVLVLPNGVAVPAELPVAARGGHFLFVGRFVESKGVFDLLAALRQVRAQWPDIRLALAGEGDMRVLGQHIAALGIAEQVEHLGWLSGAQLPAAVAGARAVVLPSYSEGLPMVLLEAMALGTPVIATSVGGVGELISHGHSGWLLQAGDVAGLAQALLRLAADDELAARLGRNGRAVVENGYTLEASLRTLEQLYARAGIRRKDMSR